jgi:mannose-1-phosphate guanylyltransferase/mannose-1-phosphate guanylyltransferase/mannose-6-phosphate isomerase
MFSDCLIMAGGSGARLWPASNSAKPKQFLSIAKKGDGSFFSGAVERALAVIDGGGSVTIIAGRSHLSHVISLCAKLGAAQKKRLVLIPEPEAKNTAPAIACAVTLAAFSGDPASSSGRNMLVLTSDHIIKPPELFARNAATAAEFAARGALVVFGIFPARPETGYGYIEAGKPVGAKGAAGVCGVAAFHEKPAPEIAKKFAAAKRFFWNSGMFAFSVEFMKSEFRRLAGEVIGPFEKLKAPDAASWTTQKGLRILSAWPGLDAAYRKTKNISFDYAIAEKCGQAVMVRADFDWIDVGNWEEYAKLLGDTGAEVYCAPPGHLAKNGCSAAPLAGCFVDSDIPVALAGVEDLIVVIRTGKNGAPPAALITKKGETQRVRDIVEQIKKAGKNDIL